MPINYEPSSRKLLGFEVPVLFQPYANPDRITSPKLRQWIDSVNTHPQGAPNIVFHGPRGTHKTTYAWTLCNAAALVNRTITFINVAELWEKLNGPKGAELVDDLAHVDVLVLDDLTIVSPGPVPLTRLYAVLDARYSHKRPTIATCNKDLRVLEAAIGSDSFERLMHAAFVMNTVGESSRELGAVEEL